jgi:hypothetical protein
MVPTHSKEGDDHVQLRIWSSEVVLLREEALLGEAAAHQQLLQLVLRLPGHAHRRHVQPLVVAEVHLAPLAALTRVLPTLKSARRLHLYPGAVCDNPLGCRWVPSHSDGQGGINTLLN